jgi:hypothetical protein
MTLTEVGLPPDGAPPDPGQGLKTTTHSHDISGSGISFDSDIPIAPGTAFSIVLTAVNEIETLQLRAYVVRSYRHQADQERPGFRIGLAFMDISDEARSSIVRHVYRTQMKDLPSLAAEDASQTPLPWLRPSVDPEVPQE